MISVRLISGCPNVGLSCNSRDAKSGRWSDLQPELNKGFHHTQGKGSNHKNNGGEETNGGGRFGEGGFADNLSFQDENQNLIYRCNSECIYHSDICGRQNT